MAAIACFEVRVWSFHCPECGFGHQELGHLATDQEIHCLVCLEEDGRLIHLQRWTEIEWAPGQARLRGGLAAA